MHKFQVKMSCPSRKPNPSFGSILHGMLIDHLPDEWKEMLHSEQIRPVSQWVEGINETDFIWHVSVLDESLGDMLGELFRKENDWECRYLNTSMHIETVSQKQTGFQEYIEPFYLAEEPHTGINLIFRTVTTHKTQGKYATFPSVSLIANSISKRICSIRPDFSLSDPECLEQIIERTSIARYQLRSAFYELEHSRVTGYIGQMELRFSGSDELRRLAGILFAFAPWSGVGIKTALGMGGCDVSLLKRSESAKKLKGSTENCADLTDL